MAGWLDYLFPAAKPLRDASGESANQLPAGYQPANMDIAAAAQAQANRDLPQQPPESGYPALRPMTPPNLVQPMVKKQ